VMARVATPSTTAVRSPLAAADAIALRSLACDSSSFSISMSLMGQQDIACRSSPRSDVTRSDVGFPWSRSRTRAPLRGLTRTSSSPGTGPAIEAAK
jgi:hypothetical protein